MSESTQTRLLVGFLGWLLWLLVASGITESAKFCVRSSSRWKRLPFLALTLFIAGFSIWLGVSWGILMGIAAALPALAQVPAVIFMFQHGREPLKKDQSATVDYLCVAGLVVSLPLLWLSLIFFAPSGDAQAYVRHAVGRLYIGALTELFWAFLALVITDWIWECFGRRTKR